MEYRPYRNYDFLNNNLLLLQYVGLQLYIWNNYKHQSSPYCLNVFYIWNSSKIVILLQTLYFICISSPKHCSSWYFCFNSVAKFYTFLQTSVLFFHIMMLSHLVSEHTYVRTIWARHDRKQHSKTRHQFRFHMTWFPKTIGQFFQEAIMFLIQYQVHLREIPTAT